MTEIWKDIKGYEGYYMVSSNGLVKSISRVILDKRGNQKRLQGKLLRCALSDSGYLNVSLCKNGIVKCVNVHSVIASNFIGATKKLTVNHKNCIKTDNRVCNLELITQSENSKHLFRNLLSKSQKIILDTNCGVYYYSINDASEYVGVRSDILSRMFSGKKLNTTSLILA